jgi:Ca2+-transporting ATPase
MFSARFLRSITWYASLITAVTLAAFWIALQSSGGSPTPRMRTMSFMTLALAQAFHLGNARSQAHVLTVRQAVSNPFALGAVALVVLLQVISVHFAPLAAVLGTEPLGARDWLVCVALALVPAVIGQGTRLLSKKRPISTRRREPPRRHAPPGPGDRPDRARPSSRRRVGG